MTILRQFEFCSKPAEQASSDVSLSFSALSYFDRNHYTDFTWALICVHVMASSWYHTVEIMTIMKSAIMFFEGFPHFVVNCSPEWIDLSFKTQTPKQQERQPIVQTAKAKNQIKFHSDSAVFYHQD